VWVYRLWIKCRPDDPQKYYYLSSALRRRDRLSKAVQAFADGMVVQQRLAAKTGAPADVRYLGESWTHAIGHIALLDVIAKRQLLGLAPTHHVILARGKVANSPYLDLWRRHFEIVSDAIQIDRWARHAEYTEDYPTVITIDGVWKSIHEAADIIEDLWSASLRGPLLSLPPAYEIEGKDILTRLGVPPDAWFVTMHLRQEADSLRDANVADYQDGIRKITEAGGWVIRIGGPSLPP